MKSPNNTAEVPDVNFLIILDYGLCFTEKKIRETSIWKKELRKKTFNCNTNVRKSEKSSWYL